MVKQVEIARGNRETSYFRLLPRAHAQGVKQSVLSVVCRPHENRQILISRHLSDSQAQRIHRNGRKTGFTVFRIVWYGPRTSQIGCFVGHTYRPHPQQASAPRATAMCRLVKVVNRHMHTYTVADLRLLSAESA